MESDEEAWDQPLPDPKFREGISQRSTQVPCETDSSDCYLHKRVIVHIDIDCFYAQVEMIRNPELRSKPLGVQQKYIIVTCNYPARDCGLTKLMTVKEARRKCPDLVLVNGEDLSNYRTMSYKISNFLQKYVPCVERLGFDENFLDITDLVNERIRKQGTSLPAEVKGHVYSANCTGLSIALDGPLCQCGCHQRLTIGSHVAAEIRLALSEELGITCCAGVAHNKLLSKLVAGSHKPNQQTTLFPEHVRQLVAQMNSVRNIPGIGHATAHKLKELGVFTVQDLQEADPSILEPEFGPVATETMKKLSVGIDTSQVTAFGLPQTLSDEDSFRKCSNMPEASSKIQQLILSLLKRLLTDGRRPQTLRVTVRRMTDSKQSSHRESRQSNIPSPIWNKFSQDNLSNAADQLQTLAMGLFTKMVDVCKPFHLTLINVAFAKLETNRTANSGITMFFSPQSASRGDHCNNTQNIEQQELSSVKDNTSSKLQAVANGQSEPTLNSRFQSEDKVQDDSSVSTSSRVHDNVHTPQHLRSTTKVDSSPNQDRKSKKNKKEKQSGLTKWLRTSPKAINSGLSVDKSLSSSIPHTPSKECPMRTSNYGSQCTSLASQTLKTSCIKRHIDHQCVDSLSKKQKTCAFLANEDFREPELSEDHLPSDIDKQVFLELPSYIQKEILESSQVECKRQSGNNLQPECSSFTDKAHLKKSNPDPCGYKSDLCSKENGPSGTESDPFGRDTNQCSIAEKDTPTVDANACISAESTNLQVDPEIPLKISSSHGREDESLETKSEKLVPCSKLKTVNHTLQDSLTVPPGVDRVVFLSLPDDIQKELCSDWLAKVNSNNNTVLQSKAGAHKLLTKPLGGTQRKHAVVSSGSGNNKQTVKEPKTCSSTSADNKQSLSDNRNSQKPFFKMPKPSSDVNILSFFSKR